jgi:hypothetical protein
MAQMGFKWFDKEEGEGVLGVLGVVEGNAYYIN